MMMNTYHHIIPSIDALETVISTQLALQMPQFDDVFLLDLRSARFGRLFAVEKRRQEARPRALPSVGQVAFALLLEELSGGVYLRK